LFFPLFSPVEIFAFLEGAICLFRIHFWSDFSWFGQHFGSQNPPGGLPGRIQKKRRKLMPIFILFRAVLATPWGTENRQKMLGCTYTVLLFLLQKRFCRKVDFQDGILVDYGFQNVNFGSLVLVFLIYF